MNELLEYFKSKPEIQKVVIYGSRAKGTYRTGSDVDFAIWSNKDNLIGIPTELNELPIQNSIDKDGKPF